MADDPESPVDRDALGDVGGQAADNYRRVGELEERLDTLTAALAEVLQFLKQQEADHADRIEADLGETEATDTDAASDTKEDRPRGYW